MKQTQTQPKITPKPQKKLVKLYNTSLEKKLPV